jgi:hypothetical protein
MRPSHAGADFVGIIKIHHKAKMRQRLAARAGKRVVNPGGGASLSFRSA